MTLIVQAPDAAEAVTAERIVGLARPGAGLLVELIETVHEEPNISTAGLLERFRDHPEGRFLGQLASIELPESEEFDPAAELAACMAQLGQAHARERIEFLIEKQRDSGLSDDERRELREATQKPRNTAEN